MQEMSLPALFEQARNIHAIDLVKKGCELLRQCEEMVNKLGLFSLNETKDDISTANLKYILVPYYLAVLTEKIAEDGRIKVLKASLAKLKEFISFCEAMKLVPEEEMETSKQDGANTFADRRAKKVVLLLCFFLFNLVLGRRGRSTKASALSTPVETGEDDVLDDDGEEEREAWLTTISLALRRGERIFQLALDERTKEVETWHRDAAARGHYSKPATPITCATFAQDVIEGRANVSQAHEHKHQPLIFGPASLVGRNPTTELPTMGIEEAGLTEMNTMNEWQERNMKLMEEAHSSWHRDAPKSRPGEEDEEDDDAAQDKAKAWDDWKDDNPRGAGNKKLTPCG
ncbi:unnamed protein product [Withania somnifera]